jgi:dolichyl-phosphate-mannose--protein O-mannosyl transferase
VNKERAGYLLLGIAAVLWVARLDDPPGSYRGADDPPEYVHDECYQAFTAHRFAMGDRDAWNPFATRDTAARITNSDMTRWTTYEWVHPPTAKLIMALLIKMFGFQPTAYRLGSVIFGLLTLFFAWQLSTRMFGADFGLITLALLCTDGLVFTMSRVAMNDIYVTACTTLAMYLIYRWWTEGGDWRHLLGAGLTFAVGLTMKWNAGPLGFGMFFIVTGRIAYQAIWGEAPPPAPVVDEKEDEDEKSKKKGSKKKSKKKKDKPPERKMLAGKQLLQTLGALGLGWLVAPPIFYLVSYIPYFLQDYSWADFSMLNHQIWWYHHNLKATHSMSSLWWEWPWITRPVWFFLHNSPGEIRVIYAMGNPALWWVFLPCLAWVTVRYAMKREPADGLILCGFFGVWFPWIFVGRVAFIQYLLPAVPFGAMAVARALMDLGALVKQKWIPIAWVAIVAAVFINFYPFWSGYPIPHDVAAGKRYYWFDAWRKP